MKEIDIEIENKQFAEMGIEQKAIYATLHFNPSKFIGYWIDSENETITFYLETQSFICAATQRNINILESILL